MRNFASARAAVGARRRPSPLRPCGHRSTAWLPSVSPIPAIWPRRASRFCGSSPMVRGRSWCGSMKRVPRTFIPATGWTSDRCARRAATTSNAVEGVGRRGGACGRADQRAFTVKVTFPGTVTARSGSFARVVVPGRTPPCLLVPATRDSAARPGVIGLCGAGRRGEDCASIQVGPSTSAGVEVLAGLDAGESIVTSPHQRLMDGATVTIGGVRGARAGGPP